MPSRRAFLVLGAAAGLGLAGCTAGGAQLPGRSGSAAKSPVPTPTPLPGTVDATARENGLAAFAATALHHFSKELSTADRNLLHRLRDAHLLHAAVLQQTDPTAILPAGSATGSPTASSSDLPGTPSGTPSSTPSSTPSGAVPLGHSVSSTLAKLRTLETEASEAYSGLAADPGGPAARQDQLALLWGSLAAASAAYAAACHSGDDPGAALVAENRTDVALPADADTAISRLLAQCYAIIFGYQSAIAALSGSRADRAQGRLSDYRELRDHLAALLTDHKAQVPAAHAAYRLPVQPESTPSAVRLIGLLETRVLPYFGQWLAVADPDDRPTVLRSMISNAEQALVWAPGIPVWPGYPTT